MKRTIYGLLVFFLCTSLVFGVTVTDKMTYEGPVTFKGGINQSGSNMTVSPSATGYLNITTGNLKVGDGTPGTTLTGEDAYIEGTLEVDGVARFDATTMTLRGVTYTLPSTDGTAGAALTTDGSAALSWSAGAAGNTLDTAYDQGGAGVGRTISATDGAVVIQNTDADTTNILEINKSPSGGAAGSGVAITMGANATGAGISFANTGSGNDLLGSGSTWSISKTGTLTAAAASLASISQTGNWTIGGGTNTIGINTSTWDISTSGALSGITTASLSDDLSLANGKAIKGSVTNAETIAVQSYDVDGAAYINSILLTNGNTPAVAIGTNAETVAINSSDWDISTTGAMTGIGAITMDGLLTGTLGTTITGATINLNASSNFAVNIGTGTTTGTVTVGGAGNQSIDIGNGAAVKAVALGSDNTTSSTVIKAGTGDLAITSVDDITINGGSAGSIITVGGNTDGNVINVGADDTTADTISIGSAKDTSSLAGIGVTVGSTGTTSALTLQSGSGGVGINVSNNQPTNINTGTSNGTVTIGNVATPAVVAINGTTSINTNGAALATNIATGTTTGTVTIGGAGAQSIDIGNGAAAKTVTLGSTNTTSTTTINSGSGNINLGGNVVATGKTITGALQTVTTDNNGSTLTSAACGTVQVCSGAGVTDLPEASTVIGCRITFVVGATANCDLNPADADQILLLTNAAGDAVRADAIGETVSVIAIDATNWVTDGTPYGTWTDVN